MSRTLQTYAVLYSYPTCDRYYRGQVGVRVRAYSEADALERIRRGTADTGYRACPDAQIVRIHLSTFELPLSQQRLAAAAASMGDVPIGAHDDDRDPDVDCEPVRTWVDATSCIAVMSDRDGLWVATRDAPTDMWSPPEPLNRADGPDPHFEHPREASSHADRERDPA